MAEPATTTQTLSMRPIVAEVLVDLSDRHPDLVVVTADARALTAGVERRHPARAVDVGIAEANLVGVAAGLARGGSKVVVAAMAPFLVRRAAEQIRIDVCRPGLDVTFLGVGGGLSYGSLGASHHVPEDLAAMSAMPGVRVFCPADVHDAAWAVREAVDGDGPGYVRLGARADTVVHDEAQPFSALQPRLLGPPGGALVVATGSTVAEALHAAQLLRDAAGPVRVLALTAVHPFPEQALFDAVRTATVVVTVEDHFALGGIAGRVALTLAGRHHLPFAALAVDDRPAPALDRDDLYHFYGINAATIARTVLELTHSRAGRAPCASS
ncbi:hypothetical protein OHA72_57275 [Dactylosporangium sp. NBC_01737]|uniref:transketolase family protein n=1 Tax=Dactylosporangium sp. NBC_01737 TaxID=2975959 RepID=UPI002E0D3CAA|nr:hypothetical protein OHA72_57275 [Dactylosporangium sp. NBC_01737]